MAKMSNSLVKQFAKTITQSVPQEKSKSSNALGTLVKEGNIFYAMLDGSTFLTPVSMSMSGEEGDRVLVTIQNHSAIVTSNITAPGATTKYVERVEADLTTFKDVTVKNLLAGYIRTDELEAKVGILGYLKVTDADVTYLKAAELEAKVGTFGYLKTNQLESEVAKFGYLKTGELAADVANLGYLKVTEAEATYLKVDELEGKVATFGYLKVGELEGAVGKFGYLTADQASLKYAQIDFANVTGQVVGTSLIKDGAITDAKILGLSANKITAGILDAAKITVTNLNADNITVGTLNGKLIGTGSVDLNKLAEEVPTKEYLDSVQNGLQDQIDKSVQTYTVTAIPLLSNTPAQDWTTDEYPKHVGDVCYVVNPGGQADGYTYRFEKDGDTYGWSLIKDSQVTEALQKLLNVNGDLSGLKSFQSETSSWITKTDSELSSVKSRTTIIETTYSTKAEAKNLADDAKKYADDAVDGIEIGGRNLFLKTGVEHSNNDYATAWYRIANEPLVPGEIYTVTICVTPGSGVGRYVLYFSLGYTDVTSLNVHGTSKQTVSKTFRMPSYYPGNTPDDNIRNTDAQIYRYPNDGTVTENSTIHWIKIEKGTKATDWTPAPEDIDQALSTKVDTTTFNEVKQTVDTNFAQITQMTKTLEQKADGSTVESLQQTVNKVQQTANENVSKISQVTQSVERAQSTADDANNRIDIVEKTGTGGNLIKNGYGELLDNTNFENGTFTRGDCPDGCYGYFTNGITEKIPFNPNLTYELEYYCRLHKGASGTNYFSIVPYDVDGLVIGCHHILWDDPNLFYLSQDLKNGDTVAHFVDLNKWYLGTSYIYERGFLIFGYKDSTGYTYPDGTYSRNYYPNVYTDDSSVDKVNNTITLRSPWTGGTVKAGTCIGHSVEGSTYCYYGQLGPLTNIDWKKYTRTVEANNNGQRERRLLYAKSIAVLLNNRIADYAKLYLGEQNKLTPTVETLSKLTNEVKQTADSNSAKITQMNQTIAQKADGSKVTALEERTSSVEQNLSGFKSEVSRTYTTKTEFENLEIGGRNLIPKSKNLKLPNDESGVTFTRTADDCTLNMKQNSPGAWYSTYINLTLEKNTTYTVSVEISNIKVVDAGYAVLAVCYNPPEASAWNDFDRLMFTTIGKQHITFNTGDHPEVRIACGLNGSEINTVTFKNLKLEKGTKATDWTPAPEDMTAEAQDYATAAKNEAISAAASDATSKVNKGIKQATSIAANDAASKANQALSNAINDTKQRLEKYVTTTTYNSYVQQTDSKIAAKLESSTFNSFQDGEYSNFKKSTNEFIGTSEAWEMKWNKIFNGTNAAEDTYQSYITFQNGEQILGNSKSNIKLHLKNDVIQFEDSNGNALASFDAANIYLGKNGSTSVIDLCNGLGKIRNESPASGYKGLTIIGTDQTVIKSRYVVNINTIADTDNDWYGSKIELSTNDTPWYGDTSNGGSITLTCRGGNHVGTMYLTEGELMFSIDDGSNTGFLQITNAENRVTLCGNQIHLAGKTYPEQGIFLPSNGTWWIGGKTATNCIVGYQQTTASYHPAFRINSAGGHVWNIGGINNEIGFYGFKASRADNDNGVDFYTRWDMNNWDLIHSGYFEAQGLINTKFEYRSWRGGRDWRFGAQTGTGDDNQFGFYDATYGFHGSIVGSDHSLRMVGDIYAGHMLTGNESVGIRLGGYKNDGQMYLYATMNTQNLWLCTRVNSNTSSASWAWYNVTAILQKSSSDKRLKTNVRFSNVNALDAIDRMCVRSFNRIDEGGLYYSIGFIADELEEINPTLVSGGGYTEEGHPYYKSINGIYLTSYAIKGIQELHKKVTEQTNIINQETAQLQAILGQIEALRNKLHELEMAM